MKVRQTDVIRVANELFEQGPDWVVFFHEVLGIKGLIRQVYDTPEAMAAFEKTEEYAEIKQMLSELRRRAAEREHAREATRVITVRMPKTLHESLKAEASEHKVSINQLCIAKLLKIVDEQTDLPKRRDGHARKKKQLEADL